MTEAKKANGLAAILLPVASLILPNLAEAEIIKHEEGADPAAVIFDAIKATKARNADVLICDTAGRLHNKKNLMEELKKIYRIIDKELNVTDHDIEEAVLEGAQNLEDLQHKLKVGVFNKEVIPQLEDLLRFYNEKYYG